MVLKSASLIAFAGLFVAVSAVAQQSEEPFWKVLNKREAEVIPPYKGQQNPFPMKIIVTVDEREKEETVDPALAGETAYLLAKLRQIIDSERVTRPKIERIVIDGYLESDNDASVYVMNKWLKKGDSLDISSETMDNVEEVVSSLRAINPDLGVELIDELGEKIREHSVYKVEITKVTDQYMEVKDKYDRTYVISFVSFGW